MPKARIALVGKYYPPVHGGIEDHVKLCAQTLADEYDVKAFCLQRGPCQPRETEVEGVPLFLSGSIGSVWRQELATGTSAALERWRPDVIHFHSPNPWVAAMLAPWCGRAKIVVTHHADLMRPPPIRQIAWHFYRQWLRAARTIIAFTRSYADSSAELAGFREKIVVVPHGVEPGEFRRRDRWTGLRRIGYLGRLERWKGVHLLLDLARARPDLEIHVAGAGSQAAALQDAAREAGVDGRVRFLGPVWDAQRTDFLCSLDALVLPSLNMGESFGIVLVQAQLCGVPVVASDLPTGVSEIAADGRFGWTFRTGDAASLGAALARLQADPPRVIEVIESAYRNALERYTPAPVAGALREVMRRAAA